jgi:hypothetical protein
MSSCLERPHTLNSCGPPITVRRSFAGKHQLCGVLLHPRDLVSSRTKAPPLGVRGVHPPPSSASSKPRMANSKYAYVRAFELDDTLLPGCFVVIRVDGKGFTK